MAGQTATFPVVYITPEAKQKLDLYIQAASGEISGLGDVIIFGDDFLIRDVFLFKQTCTGSTSDLNTEDIAQFLLEAVMADLDMSGLKLWWHSHVNMGTYWSKTDDQTADLLSSGGWFLSIVGVKCGDYLCRLDIDDPVRLTLDGLKLRMYYPEDESLRAVIDEEVRQKVTNMHYAATPLKNGAYQWKGEPSTSHSSESSDQRHEVPYDFEWID